MFRFDSLKISSEIFHFLEFISILILVLHFRFSVLYFPIIYQQIIRIKIFKHQKLIIHFDKHLTFEKRNELYRSKLSNAQNLFSDSMIDHCLRNEFIRNNK